MNESEAVTVPVSAPRRWPWILLSLVLLAVVAVGGLRGWKLWRLHVDTEEVISEQKTELVRMGREIGDAQGQIEQLRARSADLTENQQQNADAISALQGHDKDFETALQSLSSAVQGGRTRAQLVTVEQLLLIANDRAQLAKDAGGAATALQLAQDRLATVTDPRLFDVRKAIADERTALLAVPAPDATSISLTIASLIERVPNLPRLEQGRMPQATAPMAEESRSRKGTWASIRQVFTALFVVNRTDKPVRPLLLPEEQALIGDLLELHLESARLALLRADTQSFHGALDSARKVLMENFQPADPAVNAVQHELQGLEKVDLSPALPDITRSLGLLRAFLDATPT